MVMESLFSCFGSHIAFFLSLSLVSRRNFRIKDRLRDIIFTLYLMTHAWNICFSVLRADFTDMDYVPHNSVVLCTIQTNGN